MAVFSGPEIISNGLVLALDAGNLKGYDKYENLIIYSEEINNWANNGNAISISPNSQIAPNGTLTADVLSQTAVAAAGRWVSSFNNTGNFNYPTYTAGETYTISIWLKKVSGTDTQPSINLWVWNGEAGQSLINQSVGTLTTEWVRYSATFTPSTTISVNNYTGLDIGWDYDGAANNFTFAAWGFQMERAGSATDYYKTTIPGTAKTRGTTWIDLSGNNGTLVGPTYDIGNGGSLAFDGNDYVSTPLISGTSFTWSVWFKTNVTANGYRNIISIPTPSFMLMLMDNDTNDMGFWASDTLTTGSSLNMGPITPNTWNYATFVRQGNNIANGYKTYINGFFRGSANTGIWSSLSPIWLGGRSDINQFLNGNIAQVSIYNRALTASEIQQNFNATKSRYGL